MLRHADFSSVARAMRWAWSGVAAGLGRRGVRIDGPSRGLVRVYSAEEPDWEAMYRGGGGSSYAADWESGADDGDASAAVADWAITAVSVSESALTCEGCAEKAACHCQAWAKALMHSTWFKV